MFFEIIRFAARGSLPASELKHCFDLLRRLHEIDVVLDVFIGRDLGDGGGATGGFTHSVIVTMPGREFFGAYQRHRNRDDVSEYVMPRLAKSQVIHISGTDEVRRRLRMREADALI